MKTRLLIAIGCLVTLSAFGQKKVLDHADFDIWNTIQNQRISNDGKYIMYSLERGEEDNFLKIKDTNGNLVFEHERGYNGRFTYDGAYAIFTIKPWHEQLRELKRKKTKKDERSSEQ